MPPTCGPYRLLEPLGRGGMGVVYRAVHRETRQAVALKTVPVAEQWMLESIRREIRALARIRHPGIVRILDEGVEQGLPWYAMELIEGIPLRQYCASLQAPAADPEATRPVPGTRPVHSGAQRRREPRKASAGRARAELRPSGLRPVLTLLRKLCAPLAYLHGEGIVHRDLKPDNILVRPDAEPVIVDFGLSSRFADPLGREELEVPSGAAGTLAYMAPEQRLHGLLDARADLYSLGCILYELLTGRLDALPAPPSQTAESIPPELDALVSSLLAELPRDRLGHADLVALQLERLGAGPAMAGPRPRAYLYRPGLAGREEQFRSLERLLVSLQAGAGGAVLIGGESGVGKTRLLQELGQRARHRKLHVLTGGCLPGVDAPLQGLRRPLQQLADRCRERGIAETERILGHRGRLLALYEPALAALPGQSAHPEPFPLPPPAARLRLFSALRQSFAALAEQAPVLLLLDDMHLADELTLGALEFFLGSSQSGWTPLFIAGAYRTEETSPALQSLLALPGLQRQTLALLDTEAVASMVGDMLALEPPPALFVQFLARHSEGNPFFVAEYLRAAVAEEVLYRDSAGRWQIRDPAGAVETQDFASLLPLPRSIRDLVGRRIDGLHVPARRVVAAASVLGRELDSRVLAKVAGLEEEPLLQAVEELLARQVLQEGEQGGLRFVHDKIREVAYDRLADTARRALHLAAAEAVDVLQGPERDEQLAALGHHWEQAGQPLRAGECYLAAARKASSRYAHVEAERLYRAYLRLVQAPTAESIQARNELGGTVLEVQGRYGEAIEQLEQACDEGRDLGNRPAELLALRKGAWSYWRTGQLEKSHTVYGQALSMAREDGDRLSEGIILDNFAVLHMQQGRRGTARAFYEQALAIARELENPAMEGGILGNLANLDQHEGRIEEALERNQQTLAFARRCNARRSEAITRLNLGGLRSDQGQFEEAHAMFEQALAIAREIGDRDVEANCLGNLGSLAMHQSRSEEARTLHEEALDMAREMHARAMEGIILGNLSVCSLHQGRIEEAKSFCEQALAIAQELVDPPSEGFWRMRRAALERYAGQLPEAWELLRHAEIVLVEFGTRCDLAVALCEKGHLCLADAQSGSPSLVEARDLAIQLKVAPRSELVQALERLERAQSAFEVGEGRRLFRGQLVADLPAGLRQWLVRTGRLEEES